MAVEWKNIQINSTLPEQASVLTIHVGAPRHSQDGAGRGGRRRNPRRAMRSSVTEACISRPFPLFSFSRISPLFPLSSRHRTLYRRVCAISAFYFGPLDKRFYY
jgi:hypothetical protein